jgi:hypothetical protein
MPSNFDPRHFIPVIVIGCFYASLLARVGNFTPSFAEKPAGVLKTSKTMSGTLVADYGIRLVRSGSIVLTKGMRELLSFSHPFMMLGDFVSLPGVEPSD